MHLTSIDIHHTTTPNLLLHSANSDTRRSGALVALGRKNLVVLRAQRHTLRRPRIEVVSDGDGARSALGVADGPVLRKGCSSLDGWSVGALGGVEGVAAAVTLDAADFGASRAGVCRDISEYRAEYTSLAILTVGAVRLDDVVLHQGIRHPAVDGEVAVAVGVEVGRVGDGPEEVRKIELCKDVSEITDHCQSPSPCQRRSCCCRSTTRRCTSRIRHWCS